MATVPLERMVVRLDTTENEMLKVLEERNKALATLDMNYARRLMPEASSDHVRLIVMHKLRYECLSLPHELRHASAEWLRSYGYGRMDGTPLLPAGELPL
jgi:hypothetical protein